MLRVRSIYVIFVPQGSPLRPHSPPCFLSDIVTQVLSVISPLFLLLSHPSSPPPYIIHKLFSSDSQQNKPSDMQSFLKILLRTRKCSPSVISLSSTPVFSVGDWHAGDERRKKTKVKKERGGHKHDDRDVVGSEQTWCHALWLCCREGLFTTSLKWAGTGCTVIKL